LNLCIYCGDWATQRDHLRSRNRRKKPWNSTSLGSDSSYYKTVPSCFQCNRTLGNYPSEDIRERAEYLVWKLHHKASPERLRHLKKVAYLVD